MDKGETTRSGKRGRNDGEKRRRSPLDDLPLYISRLHYNYVALLEIMMAKHGLDKAGLRPGMGLVLFALLESEDQIISEIARRVQLSNSTLTGLLNSMEKSGLITRHKDPHDGRAVRICLTDHARGLEDPYRRMHEEILGILCQDLDPVKVDEVRLVMAWMVRSIRDAGMAES
jgi:MarR family transcriptional regulator, organic hydroperoxide resistance regulator